MSAKDFISGTNVMFLLAGAYFVAISVLGEGSTYSVVGAVFCFIAVGLAFRKSFFVTGPWRTAAAAFSLVIFLGQLVANASATYFSNIYLVGSTLINGALLIVFIGVLLSTSREISRKARIEEQEDEKKESKKITFQV